MFILLNLIQPLTLLVVYDRKLRVERGKSAVVFFCCSLRVLLIVHYLRLPGLHHQRLNYEVCSEGMSGPYGPML